MTTFGRLCVLTMHALLALSCSSLPVSLPAILYFTSYTRHPSGSDKYSFINEKESFFPSFSDNV